jgi:hypothetical protein
MKLCKQYHLKWALKIYFILQSALVFIISNFTAFDFEVDTVKNPLPFANGAGLALALLLELGATVGALHHGEVSAAFLHQAFIHFYPYINYQLQ